MSSLTSAFKSQDSASRSCHQGDGIVDRNFTYVQLDLLDQHAIEPYFYGELFLSLNNAYGKDAVRVTFTESASRGFGQNVTNVDLRYDEAAQTLWMAKAADIALNRLSGAHRDFPFDSAKFDFDLSYLPLVPIHNVLIRNRNPSFDLDCSTFHIEGKAPGMIHITFEAHRNPVVQLTAIVLVGAGFLFLIGIVVFVKRESLPTSIASFFFSLWSIRAILSSEMKTFPTVLDLAILSLCVLLVVALGVRLAVKEIPTSARLDAAD